jgi:hypothetical protein
VCVNYLTVLECLQSPHSLFFYIGYRYRVFFWQVRTLYRPKSFIGASLVTMPNCSQVKILVRTTSTQMSFPETFLTVCAEVFQLCKPRVSLAVRVAGLRWIRWEGPGLAWSHGLWLWGQMRRSWAGVVTWSVVVRPDEKVLGWRGHMVCGCVTSWMYCTALWLRN